MVLRQASAVELVEVVGRVVTGVLQYSAGNCCLTECTIEVQRFLKRDIWIQRYVMVLRYASSVAIVEVIGGVVTGVFWQCMKLVPNLMYL